MFRSSGWVGGFAQVVRELGGLCFGRPGGKEGVGGGRGGGGVLVFLT